MKKPKLHLTINGVEVTGKITQLEKFYLEVEILQPYVNWTSFLAIGGLCRSTPNHFLTEHGDKYAHRILTESYKKIKIIDEKIDRIVEVHDDLIEEASEVSKLTNETVKKRVIEKLNDWFYHDFIFTSCVTGMITTISDRPQIEEIIKTYKKEKRKIYLT